MPKLPIQLGIEYFADPTKGYPIFNGQVYFGKPNTDPEVLSNRIDVKTLGDVIVPQPVQLNAGGVPMYGGSPVALYAEEDYSIKVLDMNGAEVYYVESQADMFTASGGGSSPNIHTLIDAYASFNSVGALIRGYKVSSVTDLGAAVFSVNYTETMDYANHIVAGLSSVDGDGNALTAVLIGTNTTAFFVEFRASSGDPIDPDLATFIVAGAKA